MNTKKVFNLVVAIIYVVIGIFTAFSEETEIFNRLHLVLLGALFILMGINDYRKSK